MADGSDINIIDGVMTELEQKGTPDENRGAGGYLKKDSMKLWGFIYTIGMMLKILNRKKTRYGEWQL